MAEPKRERQSYADFKPDEFGICHFFQDVKKFPYKLRSENAHTDADVSANSNREDTNQ